MLTSKQLNCGWLRNEYWLENYTSVLLIQIVHQMGPTGPDVKSVQQPSEVHSSMEWDFASIVLIEAEMLPCQPRQTAGEGTRSTDLQTRPAQCTFYATHQSFGYTSPPQKYAALKVKGCINNRFNFSTVNFPHCTAKSRHLITFSKNWNQIYKYIFDYLLWFSNTCNSLQQNLPLVPNVHETDPLTECAFLIYCIFNVGGGPSLL